MAEVDRLCDRVLILKDGKIVDDGTPASLAKKLEISHLNLRVTRNRESLDKLVRAHGLEHIESEGLVTVSLQEGLLPLFLYELTKENIRYSEISIDKPTLEDYFLSVAKGGSNEAL